VTLLTIAIAGIYSVFSLTLYRTFKDTNYDLVIFDQAIRSYSHFHLAISPIKGMHDGNGPNFSVLGDHFSPIIAVLAPLYWIYGNPQTLLVAQAILFALATPPLWIFTRRAFGGGRKATSAAYLICVAYGLCWPLVAAAHYDFHEVAFAPLLTVIALERFQAGRLRSALIALAFLLLVKEDMGLLVAGIGAYLALSFPDSVRRQRLVGIGLVVLGVAYTAFATYVIIPAFGGFGDFYWAYSALGSNVPQVAEHIARHPVGTVRRLFHPAIKLHTLLWLFGAFCFLSLLSPLVLAAVPLLAERMLNSKYQNWWVLAFQYNAYLAIPLACAAVDGAARLDRWVTAAWRAFAGGRAARPKTGALPHAGTGQAQGFATAEAASQAAIPAHPGPGEDGASSVRSPRAATGPWSPKGIVSLVCSIAICGVVLYMVPMYKLGAMLHPWFYHDTYQIKAETAADATVPSGVVIEAANDLGSELSGRDTVLMWDGDGVTPPFAAPWVVADVHHHEFTFDSMTEQRNHVTNLLRHGYKIVFRRDGYLVLHRPGKADLTEPKGLLPQVESG
jgi:uncharacterized membrane protein